MKPLIRGANDTLDILAFKWRSTRSVSSKIWLAVVFLFAIIFLLVSALSGSALRLVLTTPTNGNGRQVQESLILWVDIFLANNASVAVGGVLWALLGSILIIPLVGYSFSSMIPEGDLASIKVTDNHKITDSIMLQFVSTIAFVQLIVVTVTTSIVTIGAPVPGLGIVISWGIWVLAVLLTVLSAWAFDWLFRKFGLKSKLLVFAGVLIAVGSLYLFFPEEFINMFGAGEAYTVFVQTISFNNLLPFWIAAGCVLLAILTALYLVSFVASSTLKVSERPKKKTLNKVFIAKLGLAEKNKIESLTQFLGNMVLRQNNIWKPIALSSGFAIVMALVFIQFYDVLLTVATLIPIMINLVWTINIFGIIGSGTTWLVSLPQGKQLLLGSVAKIQYFIVFTIAIITIGLVTVVYQTGINSFFSFILAVFTCSVVITQISLRKAVYSPFRYRVHIRGESVLPPNKAFSYMIQLFIVGFIMSGLSYGTLAVVTSQSNEIYGMLAQLAVAGVAGLLAYLRFVSLKRNWIADPEIVQNIIKTVGQ